MLPSTLPEKFDNATITGHFGIVFEETSDRKWFCSMIIVMKSFSKSFVTVHNVTWLMRKAGILNSSGLKMSKRTLTEVRALLLRPPFNSNMKSNDTMDNLLTFFTWNVISFSPNAEPVDLMTPEHSSCRRRSPSDTLKEWIKKKLGHEKRSALFPVKIYKHDFERKTGSKHVPILQIGELRGWLV